LELKPASRIQIGAIGEPGNRIFFLRAAGAEGEIALRCEKFQVEALAARLDELLSGIASELGKPRRTDYESLVEEIEEAETPEGFDWTVAELGIGYDPEDDLILVVARSVETEEAGGGDTSVLEPGDEAGGEEARIWITRGQAEVLALQGAAVVAAGRNLCPFCTLPIDPGEEHDCFARNGHKKARLFPSED
jgi:uncharacterized repeat protein (TIGR03847 family)